MSPAMNGNSAGRRKGRGGRGRRERGPNGANTQKPLVRDDTGELSIGQVLLQGTGWRWRKWVGERLEKMGSADIGGLNSHHPSPTLRASPTAACIPFFDPHHPQHFPPHPPDPACASLLLSANKRSPGPSISRSCSRICASFHCICDLVSVGGRKSARRDDGSRY